MDRISALDPGGISEIAQEDGCFSELCFHQTGSFHIVRIVQRAGLVQPVDFLDAPGGIIQMLNDGGKWIAENLCGLARYKRKKIGVRQADGVYGFDLKRPWMAGSVVYPCGLGPCQPS